MGRRQQRLDGFEKVSGRSVFTDDVRLPGMLHGKIVRSPHARARIVAIDTSTAADLPGVKVVLTGRDAPELMFSEHQPVLARDTVNYVGEEVAAVAAADLATAEEAARLIKVEYDVLEPALDIRAALKPAAPQIHTRAPGNIGPTHEQDFGDPDAAFAAADFIFEDEFKSPVQHNTLAEFHVALADFSNPAKIAHVDAHAGRAHVQDAARAGLRP